MKKRKASLPRVTLLAYSRRDLLRFSEAIEKGVAFANELEVKVNSLKDQVFLLEQVTGRLQQKAEAHGSNRRTKGKAIDQSNGDAP